MKIVIADKISDRGINLLRDAKWDVVVSTAATLHQDLQDADGLIVRSATKVTPELLEKAPKLRVVGRAGVGIDNIDLDSTTHRGVLVMNTPGGNSVGVAELTLALMLSMARSVPRLNTSIHEGKWEKAGAGGTELRGKTLGLVGLGRIGGEVARRARSFEMKILAHDPYVSAAVAQELEVELVPLADLLSRSDYVSLHTGVSAATEKMINAETLAKFKKGARLVNCARGELVDEAALADALKSGHLAGAALDTFAIEPPKNSPLIGVPALIGTPHVAGSTAEAQEEVGTQIAQQIKDYLADGQVRNAVNLPSLSAEQYRRIRPYLGLADRLGAFLAQVAGAGSLGSPARIRVRFAGEPAELGTHVLVSAVIAGLLNSFMDEKVNLVNAVDIARSRGLEIEESTRRRERGFINTIEVGLVTGEKELAIEGTVLGDSSLRILRFDGIPLEAPLEGTLLLTRNRDVPGVIGEIGTTLGKLGVNIATFALGRRAPTMGADAVALVRVDGEAPESILGPIRAIPSITEARLIHLPQN